MKKFKYNILINFLIFPLVTSCALLPSHKVAREEKKIEQAKKDLNTANQDKFDITKSYLWGADYSLSLDPNPNKYSKTAKNLTERGVIVSGTPEMDEIIKLKEIVNNLLSTNNYEIKKGQRLLLERDKEVIDLQQKIVGLQGKLESRESDLMTTAKRIGGLADIIVKLKWIFYGIIGIFIFVFISKVLSVILPPPYNSIFYTVEHAIGFVIKQIFKLFPKAIDGAKVVGSDVHQVSENTLANLVAAIQQYKANNPDKANEINQTIASKMGTNANSISKVIEVKKNLNLL